MKRFTFLFKSYPLSIIALFLSFESVIHAQTPTIKSTEPAYTKPKPTYKTTKVLKAPKIDGNLDDIAWQGVMIADNFIVFEPKPFSKPHKETEVKMVYDNEAIYLSAFMKDSLVNIRHDLSQRDQLFNANTDYFTLSLDTYDDDQNGFRFVVAASGVQADCRISPNNSDYSWDGVWESSVTLMKDGWAVEMKIPYFNLRFAKKPEQKWGFQCARSIKRLGEVSTWSPLDPKIDGQAIQWGNLEGLANIEPPLRLQFSPYLAAEYKTIGTLDDNKQNLYGNSKSITGGLDMKIGLNEAFTLDATLIPNFGQVQSDNKILNLSPFEVFFEERRPFFTEGTEMFGKGGIFYSRRIGGKPRNYYKVYNNLKKGEVVDKNPEETQLYNATKISGRTNSKVGIGVLNAIAAPMYAVVKDSTGKTRRFETSELTNYNVLVFDKLFKNNSSVSFVNALTLREGLGRDANVSALGLKLRDKKNQYELSMGGRMSHVFNNSDRESGYTYTWQVAKVSGNLTWNVSQELQDNHWNPSDLGYYQQRNYFSNTAFVQYGQYEPNKFFLQSQYWVNVNHNMRFVPFSYQDVNLNMGFWGRLKNQGSLNYWMNLTPVTYDFFEARVNGATFKRPASYNGGININTDNRKRLSSYFFIGLHLINQWDNSGVDLTIAPSLRINSHLRFGLQLSPSYAKNDYGFSTFDSDNTSLIGKRNVWNVSNTAAMELNFNPYHNITFRARHYWSRVAYNQFFTLDKNGNLSAKDYTRNVDINQNYFNIDFVYTWQFAPGSFFNFIWKNSLDNFAYGETNIRQRNYFENINSTSHAPQNNNFTVKMIYFIDYNKIKSKFKHL